MTKENQDAGEAFQFFTEIGILHQLSTSMLAKNLPDGVHPSHFAIINHLVRTGDGASPAQIALAMQVTKTTMTHSLKILSERAYISIAPDPNDGRGKLVFLSAHGRSFHRNAIARVTQAVEDIIGPEQLVRMRRIRADLWFLRKHLDENRS